MWKMSLAALVAAWGGPGASAEEPAKVDFVRDVQPLFKSHCTSCHGSKQQKNGFRLDRRRDALRGGVANQIAPGNSEASHLYFRLMGSRDGLQMPPDGPLSPEQIKVIKAWLDQGAVWPDEASGETPAPPADPKATRLIALVREGDRAAFRKLLREEPRAAKLRGPGGSTLLMYAVLYGDAESVRLLLEAGADANTRNEAGATALMWAVDDTDKTRLADSRRCRCERPLRRRTNAAAHRGDLARSFVGDQAPARSQGEPVPGCEYVQGSDDPSAAGGRGG